MRKLHREERRESFVREMVFNFRKIRMGFYASPKTAWDVSSELACGTETRKEPIRTDLIKMHSSVSVQQWLVGGVVDDLKLGVKR